MTAPEKTGRKQAATRFKPGKSGNPSGRPQGARNKASMLAQRLMEDQTETVVQTVIDAALTGDMQACKLIVERLLPPVKERALDAEAIRLPASVSAENAGEVFAEIFRAVAGGRVLPGEGKTMVELLNLYLSAHEYSELSERIDELEQAAPRKGRW
jgi:hypothetical protein